MKTPPCLKFYFRNLFFTKKTRAIELLPEQINWNDEDEEVFQPVRGDLKGKEKSVGHGKDDGHDGSVEEVDVHPKDVGQYPRVCRRPS